MELHLSNPETQKRVQGEEHPDTLIIMHNLAFHYKNENRHQEAIGLMKKVVDLRTKRLGWIIQIY